MDGSQHTECVGSDGSGSGKKEEFDTPEELEELRSNRSWILVSFWTAIVLCLPYWWMSTSIERLALPSLDPSSLARLSPPTFVEHVCLSSTARDLTEESLQQLIQQLQSLISDRGRGLDQDKILVSLANTTTSSCGVSDHVLSFPAHIPPATELAQIIDDLLPSTQALISSTSEHGSRYIKYASRLRLSFTLLLEDVTESEVTDWNIEQGLEEIFEPFLRSLSPIHNVTVRSQIQYHCPLSVEPIPLSVLRPGSEQEEHERWVVRSDDARAFVNTEKWEVDTGDQSTYGDEEDVSVLKMMIFVPRTGRKDMGFEIEHSDELSDTILLPQQGALTILPWATSVGSSKTLSLDNLRPVLQTQLQTLHTLLSVPPSTHVRYAVPSGSGITSFQLSTMRRQRAIENVRSAVESLMALERLVIKIGEMRVGKNVRENVANAVGQLEKIVLSTSPQEIFERSRTALRLSSNAFFNPTMLGLLYFPDEHKYAVYAPLFAPVGVPLIVSVFQAIRRRKRRRALGKDQARTSVNQTVNQGKEQKKSFGME
ncbi:GPI transamidase complex, GPI17/PIG-S component, involved in glycosylphosphatidylinositol anchor biosynthesis [Phaffia rhodozyma]|uniref:GPI transamidase complex, GPI17/PIG-S component, involved in glycosylphosphatidylinositol anchor biosynthesis n=1 Tax=Phaffia rhodozyma TaxID=264483 RepID=A0A0F7SLA3_PHARH|nr:GPI transamidase complex, GPI17/PIG-S component, involved in glycosylphosphatidylinositol anchor biosynthesis [Phaffia rhodozyma]